MDKGIEISRYLGIRIFQEKGLSPVCRTDHKGVTWNSAQKGNPGFPSQLVSETVPRPADLTTPGADETGHVFDEAGNGNAGCLTKGNTPSYDLFCNIRGDGNDDRPGDPRQEDQPFRVATDGRGDRVCGLPAG